MFALTIS